MNSYNNRLYMYSQPTEWLWADGEYPPVRDDLLIRLDLHGAATLAAIAFSLDELPRFCWDPSHGWLELPHTLMPAIFFDAHDFINAIPSIQAWLQEWSESAARSPNLSPDWATTRGVAPEAVKNFARGLEHQLAMSTCRRITFCDPDGTDAMLNIPSRAALSLPPVVAEDTAVLDVEAKEQTLKHVLPTGGDVMIPIGALSPTMELASVPRLIDPQRLRKKTVTHVKRVRSLPSAE